MTNNELYERAVEAAYDAGRNRDGTPPDEWTLGKAIDVVDAYLAIAPQAPVSAVPVPRGGVEHDWWEVAQLLRRKYRRLEKAAQAVVDETDRIHDNEPWPVKYRAPYDKITELRTVLAFPPPAQADDGKDTLIRELVAALDRIAKGAMYIEDFTASTSAVIWAKFALAKAKAAGFEP